MSGGSELTATTSGHRNRSICASCRVRIASLARSCLFGAVIGVGLMIPVKYLLVPLRILAPDAWYLIADHEELQLPLVGLVAARLGFSVDGGLDVNRAIRATLEACAVPVEITITAREESPAFTVECALLPAQKSRPAPEGTSPPGTGSR